MFLSTIPMHKGIYEGNQVLYIITDGSDENYAKSLSEKQEWNVEYCSCIADIPEDASSKIIYF